MGLIVAAFVYGSTDVEWLTEILNSVVTSCSLKIS